MNNTRWHRYVWRTILLSLTLWVSGCIQTTEQPTLKQDSDTTIPPSEVMVGAAQLDAYLPLLHGQRVGLIVNQTSVVQLNDGSSIHLVDVLLKHDINVVKVFAPEHGFRGNKGAGEIINDNTDPTTGLPIISLYGKNKAPSQAMLADVDVLIFDIQDVGVRFYTYISTMHYAMDAAAQYATKMIILDRPNPNGQFIDGPVLDLRWQSFVGMHPIPLVHGLTVGELAQMIKGEAWIESANALDLTVIPVLGYDKSMTYTLPIPPSPNLPNANAIQWYASLCLFEPTVISVGRGTEHPFQMLGHPTIKLPVSSAHSMQTPISLPYSAPHPKWQDTAIASLLIHDYPQPIDGFSLDLLIEVFNQARQQQLVLITSDDFFDKLAGTDTLRRSLLAGDSAASIRASWQEGLNTYKRTRLAYLLY